MSDLLNRHNARFRAVDRQQHLNGSRLDLRHRPAVTVDA
jgi:hypothetical protein